MGGETVAIYIDHFIADFYNLASAGNATFGVDALRICGKLKNDDIARTGLPPDRVDQFVHQEAIAGP